jgi:hypothetical protein
LVVFFNYNVLAEEGLDEREILVEPFQWDDFAAAGLTIEVDPQVGAAHLGEAEQILPIDPPMQIPQQRIRRTSVRTEACQATRVQNFLLLALTELCFLVPSGAIARGSHPMKTVSQSLGRRNGAL